MINLDRNFADSKRNQFTISLLETNYNLVQIVHISLRKLAQKIRLLYWCRFNKRREERRKARKAVGPRVPLVRVCGGLMTRTNDPTPCGSSVLRSRRGQKEEEEEEEEERRESSTRRTKVRAPWWHFPFFSARHYRVKAAAPAGRRVPPLQPLARFSAFLLLERDVDSFRRVLNLAHRYSTRSSPFFFSLFLSPRGFFCGIAMLAMLRSLLFRVGFKSNVRYIVDC